eukprot:5470775-Ditylum_brightwellii.AAC.1
MGAQGIVPVHQVLDNKISKAYKTEIQATGMTYQLMPNSVVSTPNAKFMMIDIKDFYLNTPMPRFEYMRLKLSNLPADFVTQYNLAAK